MSWLAIWQLAGDQRRSVSWLQHVACERIINILILIDLVILDISYQYFTQVVNTSTYMKIGMEHAGETLRSRKW